VDDDLILHLMAEPCGEDWKEPTVADALETRLQDSYDLYFETMKEMQRVMDELKQELAPNLPNDMGPGTVQSGSSPQKGASMGLGDLVDVDYLYRAKFILGESTRKRLLAELHACNDKLERLLQINDSTSALQKTRRGVVKGATASIAALCGFWDHASRLYKTLSASWGCPCRGQHCARLMLQHRTSEEKEFQLLL
ncbi:hypothetical protein B0H67DRAFT_441810, partial [Lasiosphaeris hirsuta]